MNPFAPVLALPFASGDEVKIHESNFNFRPSLPKKLECLINLLLKKKKKNCEHLQKFVSSVRGIDLTSLGCDMNSSKGSGAKLFKGFAYIFTKVQK